MTPSRIGLIAVMFARRPAGIFSLDADASI